MNDNLILHIALLGFVVTWIPRVLPFVLLKYRDLPDIVTRFLRYLPVTIIFALFLSSLFSVKIGRLPSVRWDVLLVSLPTLYVAFRYCNLMWTVLVGIVSMGLLRLFL